MYITGTGTQANTLVTTLSPLPQQPGILVRSSAPRYSPWRVIMIGDRPGDLIESNIVLNLSDPCAIKDTSWIKPGRSAWDRWWSGDYAPDATFKVGMNTETMKYYTKFAADMGWEYVIVDWTWYGDPLNPDADITRPIPEVDIPAIVQYARERNVKVLALGALEPHCAADGRRVPTLREVGHLRRQNRLHGPRRPGDGELLRAHRPQGGQSITWPSISTAPSNPPASGAPGRTCSRAKACWATSTTNGVRRVTPEHSVTLPFTRMLAGPMDFTPGGFRSVTKANFKPRDVAPFVMGTRAHQLAMMVVYESPLQVLCDSPYSYRGQNGLEFLKVTPTTWDETR